MRTVVYDKRYHVAGDLARPLTEDGNKKVLDEILEHPIEFRIGYYRTEKFLEYKKEFEKEFSKWDDELKAAFAFEIKCWFQSLKDAMKFHRVGKEVFQYGVNWKQITAFVYQF